MGMWRCALCCECNNKIRSVLEGENPGKWTQRPHGGVCLKSPQCHTTSPCSGAAAAAPGLRMQEILIPPTRHRGWAIKDPQPAQLCSLSPKPLKSSSSSNAGASAGPEQPPKSGMMLQGICQPQPQWGDLSTCSPPRAAQGLSQETSVTQFGWISFSVGRDEDKWACVAIIEISMSQTTTNKQKQNNNNNHHHPN